MVKIHIEKKWCYNRDYGLQQLKHGTTQGCGNGSNDKNCNGKFPLSGSPVAMPNSTLDHLLSHIFALYVLVYALGSTSM
jgi:hypothetical protein